MPSATPSLNSSKAVMISGWYGTDNAGDDAILEQFITVMTDRPSLQLFILTEVPERVEQRYGRTNVAAVFHSSPGLGFIKRALRGVAQKRLRSLRSCDLFVLGGGGILRDNTSYSNLIRLLDEIWIAKILGIKVALYSIGAGPFKTALGKWLIRSTLALCDLITVRELSSKEALTAIGVPPERIIVGADPALLLQPRAIADAGLHHEMVSLTQDPQTLGLFVEEDYTPINEVAHALDELHSRHKFRFVSVPMRCHGACDDRQAARLIQAKMKYPSALHLLEAQLTAPELKWLAGQFRLNITVRLHALIFSLSMGTPAVAINYEPKVAAFAKSFNLHNLCVDPDGDVANQLVNRVLACNSDLPAYIQQIQGKLGERSEAATLVFTLLKQLLYGQDDPLAHPPPVVSQVAR